MTEQKDQSERGVLIHSWVPPTLADELRQAAQVEDRSMSSVIRRAVTAHLREDPHRMRAREEEMTEITTETAVADGRRSRRVIEGEGMVEAARDFEHGGRVYEAGKSRIVADHPFVLRHPHLFRVAWADDTSAPVVRFREMTGSSSTTRGGGLYGVTRTLPRGKRPSWRID